MPIYEFKCDCGAGRELMLPFSESKKKLECECGRVMRRKFSLATFTIPRTGRERILGTLNQEEGAQDFPGGDMYRTRYEQAMSKGLDQTRPVIGRGF